MKSKTHFTFVQWQKPRTIQIWQYLKHSSGKTDWKKRRENKEFSLNCETLFRVNWKAPGPQLWSGNVKASDRAIHFQ